MQKRRNLRKRAGASGLSIACPNLRPFVEVVLATAGRTIRLGQNGKIAESWNDLCKAHCKEMGAAKY
jgi:hypothetical protein